MRSWLKYTAIWLLIGATGGWVFSWFTGSSFWFGSGLILASMSLNAWLSDKVDEL